MITRSARSSRPTGWIEGDYGAVAAEYLAGDTSRGWEPRNVVRAQFAAAVAEARETAGGRDILVVNHGLTLSLYLDGPQPEVVARGGRSNWCRSGEL